MVKKEIQIEKTLRNYLKSQNLSQNNLAKSIGITSSSLHGYLNGTVPKGVETLIKMAQELNLSLDELIFNQRSVSNNQNIPITENVFLGLLGEYELVISKKSDI